MFPVFFHDRLARVPTVAVFEKGLCQRKVPPRTQQFLSPGDAWLRAGVLQVWPLDPQHQEPLQTLSRPPTGTLGGAQ